MDYSWKIEIMKGLKYNYAKKNSLGPIRSSFTSHSHKHAQSEKEGRKENGYRRFEEAANLGNQRRSVFCKSYNIRSSIEPNRQEISP